jgi:rhodanese-related sulfurtransferase
MIAMTIVRKGVVGLGVAVMVTLAVVGMASAQGGSIYQATLAEPNQKTGEVSTEEVRRILADGSAIVLDARKRAEYVAGHIPGARTVAPSPDAPPAEYIAAVERLVGGDKSKALVLYCNGPFCQQSRRLSEQLVATGFTNVRRYQLGIPIWRALGGPTEVELEGILRIFKVDQTAVFFDARTAEEFSKGSLPGAHNVPVDALASGVLQKAPLPRNDFNTRIVLFGRDSGQARVLADAFSKTPFHNVAYFSGTFDTLRTTMIKCAYC